MECEDWGVSCCGGAEAMGGVEEREGGWEQIRLRGRRGPIEKAKEKGVRDVEGKAGQ